MKAINFQIIQGTMNDLLSWQKVSMNKHHYHDSIDIFCAPGFVILDNNFIHSRLNNSHHYKGLNRGAEHYNNKPNT